MSSRSRLLALLQTRALRRGRFVLSSGKESDLYLDCRQVTLFAQGLALVGELFHERIARLPERPVAVGGLTLGADPIAAAVALASHAAVSSPGAAPGTPGIDAFVVRKEPKGHGTNKFVEGTSVLKEGAPIVVLEDVITTGASTLRAIERCREAALRIIGVFALVDRGEDDGLANVARAAGDGVPVEALFHRRELLEEP